MTREHAVEALRATESDASADYGLDQGCTTTVAVQGRTAIQDYQTFLDAKRPVADVFGFDIPDADINPMLFAFQRDIVRWALHRGRAALFLDCGLGKTPIQLEWARYVHEYTGGDVLILAPLAVSSQTQREGVKFGVPVTICKSQADVRPGINVTNYERLKDFDPSHFSGVVLDESSILKSYMGKTKQMLLEAFANTPYRLCATATPAPNDHLEIGNHSAFLGIMPSAEMITRWFINDLSKMGAIKGGYKLKGHAVESFWDWVASWAVSMRRPSDLGYPDEGFALPTLNLHDIIVPVDVTEQSGDQLFRLPGMSATEIHKEMRITAPARAERVAQLVNTSDAAWAVWCNTNYEADELMARIPDAVEVRGSESPDAKERKLQAFSTGEVRVIVTKPSIAGFGLNWQHCHQTVFVGLSYSFEQFYQAIRRIYRFGQTHQVNAYVVAAETEGAVLQSIKRKMADHEALLDGMNSSASKLALQDDLALVRYRGNMKMEIPEWLVAA